MKQKFSILIGFILLSCAVYAQQMTQSFTFASSDLQTGKSGIFDVVGLPDASFADGEEHAGEPQLPVKHFKLLLPKGASATRVKITVNSEQQLSGNFYLYPVQLPVYPDFSEAPAFIEPDSAVYNSDNPFPADYVLNYETSGYRNVY